MTNTLFEKIYGCLVGGLIGDAIGAPSELMNYPEVQDAFNWIDDFEGSGTDDSAIRLVLTHAIFKNSGYILADDWADSFLEIGIPFYPLYYIPVQNMLHKIQSKISKPIFAGNGNLQSSSSAMAISPLGIVNACHPRQAALEAYDVASLIHSNETNFCRDGASAVAAAIAEAFKPNATIASIVEAATKYLHKDSALEMIELIKASLEKAKNSQDYESFRAWYYSNMLRDIHCDSRETIPCALSLFYIAKGDPNTTVTYCANFGRDSDTIGTIAGAIAGAFKGINSFKTEWIAKIESFYNTTQDISGEDYGTYAMEVPDYKEMASKFISIITNRWEDQLQIADMIKMQLTKTE